MMQADKEPSNGSFLKKHLIPLLVAFMIPGFGLWFFNHVESFFDGKILASILSEIKSDQGLTEDRRKDLTEFYTRIPVSRIMASNKPEAKQMQSAFESVKYQYLVFRWMKRISMACLGAGLGAMIAAGVSLYFSARSQNAMYLSLRTGWNVLKCFAVIEVIGQGILAVALSYWVTAFWFELYFVKLIIIAGAFALGAVAVLIKAIFQKLPEFTEFDGHLINQAQAPALWERITEMAKRLGIAPPDHIFVGIDDNFFVTEHKVKIGDEILQGRTLFVSLSLLKTMSKSEAEAVLAHELAHFSGEDTVYSKKISPLLGKYALYLQALASGLSLPVFYFMLLFWNGYQSSLGKISREREFRADRIGSELTSQGDMARALVKVAAYSKYRFEVQKTLFEKDESVEVMDVSARVEKGFPEYMRSPALMGELAEAGTSHPFDSHPPIDQRLNSLGTDASSALAIADPNIAESDSWFGAIEDAVSIESAQWKEFEDKFQKVHQEMLAWRFKPEGDAEAQQVVKFFPQLVFEAKKGATALLDYEKLKLSDWAAPLHFSAITICTMEDVIGGQRLVIEYNADDGKKQKHKINFKDFKHETADFLKSFERYYNRHLASKQYHEENKEKAAG